MRVLRFCLVTYVIVLVAFFSNQPCLAQVVDDDGDSDTDAICLSIPNFLTNFGNCLRTSGVFQTCVSQQLNLVGRSCDFASCDPVNVYNNFRNNQLCSCRSTYDSCATQIEGNGRECTDIEAPVDSLCGDDEVDDDGDVDDDGSLSSGAIAGIVIGSTLCCCLLLALLLAAIFLATRKKKPRKQMYTDYPPPPPPAPVAPPMVPATPVYAMPAATPIVADVMPPVSGVYSYYGY